MNRLQKTCCLSFNRMVTFDNHRRRCAYRDSMKKAFNKWTWGKMLSVDKHSLKCMLNGTSFCEYYFCLACLLCFAERINTGILRFFLFLFHWFMLRSLWLYRIKLLSISIYWTSEHNVACKVINNGICDFNLI